MFYWVEFKKLYEFNLSMLGKHAWKLFFNPGLLMTCILKAKYFPYNFIQEQFWAVILTMFGTIHENSKTGFGMILALELAMVIFFQFGMIHGYI